MITIYAHECHDDHEPQGPSVAEAWPGHVSHSRCSDGGLRNTRPRGAAGRSGSRRSPGRRRTAWTAAWASSLARWGTQAEMRAVGEGEIRPGVGAAHIEHV